MKITQVVGAFVVAVAMVGAGKAVVGMAEGTDTPADVPQRITEEFAEFGLVVPQSRNGGDARPYVDTPQRPADPFADDLALQRAAQGR